MIQAPNYVNPYLQCPVVPAPTYNAVKIDVNNPTMSAPGVGQVAMNMPQYAQAPQYPAPQYAPVTQPLYNYPQAQMYEYPQAPVQPYYMPQQPMPQMMPQTVCPPCICQQPEQQVQPAQVAQTVAPQVVPQQVIQQQNINAPQPMVTQPQQTPKETPKVEVVEPQAMAPQVDLNSFIAKLTNPDYDVQANAMEEIANMVNDNPQKATELLDEKVVNALTSIINADSSKLAGPTPEQIAARQKMMKGEQLSDAEKQLASTITPMEQAERNKSYAMFTAAIMQKLYADEVNKLTGTKVPLTELPGAVTIVEQLKNNPNPMVRTSAIEALSYVQQPEYKQDLNTLFSIAKNDQDPMVKEAATSALAKLEQLA
ncbi:HEAT repeat domain-containing protein [bacterium]|nr:HEAT repeat domain-containing protein [bacterium]